MSRQRSAVLWQWIDKLDDALRAVFIEHELSGVTVPEIARGRGLSESTVKERLYSAWAKIEQEKARWQARQRRRGESTVLWFLPLSPRDRFGHVGRALLRFGLNVSVVAAVLLLPGALPPPRIAGGVTPMPALPRGSRFATSAVDTRRQPAEDEDRDTARKGRAAVVEPGEGAPTVTKVAKEDPVAVPADAVTVIATPGDGGGAAPVQERMVIARARAMVELGTQEGQLWACRLLDDHRERYGRGTLALQRDALLRRARCDHHALTGL